MRHTALLSCVWTAFLAAAALVEPQAQERKLRLDSIRTLSGQGSTAESVAFSPDGKRLASAGIHRVVIWDVASGEQQVTIKEPDRWFMDVAFSPDGKTIAAAGSEQKVAIFDTATGAIVRVLSENPKQDVPASTEPVPLTGYVGAVAFSPDGKMIATGNSDGEITLWDTATGRKQATVAGHEISINVIAYSSDGRMLATGSHDGTARLWDTTTVEAMNAPLHTLRADGETGDARMEVVFSPDGARLYSANAYATIHEWDVQTGKMLRTLRGHGSGIVALAISPDGKQLATSSVLDETLRMWDVGSGAAIGVQRGQVHVPYAIAFSPSAAAVLATGANDGLVRLWRYRGSEPAVADQPVEGRPFVLRQEVGDDHAIVPPWQTFTAPMDGVITHVDLRPNFHPGDKGTLLIREEAIDGAVLHEQEYESATANPTEWYRFTLLKPVPVQKGKHYVWVLTGAQGLKHAKTDVYPGGSAGGDGGCDHCFRIYFEPAPALGDLPKE